MSTSVPATVPIRYARRRLSRTFGWGAFISYLVCTIVSMGTTMLPRGGAPPWLGALLPMVLLSLPTLFVAWLVVRKPFEAPGEFRIADETLFLRHGGKDHTIRRQDIDGGYVIPAVRGSAARVALDLKNGTHFEIAAGDPLVAKAILERLGLDPSKARAELTLPRPPGTWILGCFPYLASFMVGVPLSNAFGVTEKVSGLLVVFGILAGVLFVRRLAPEFVVGSDGLRVRRLGAARFIPYDRIAAVSHHPSINAHSLRIELRGGEVLSYDVGPKERESVVTLHRRIEDARRLGGGSKERGALVAQLTSRANATFSEWHDRLKALLTQKGDYRTQAIEPEDLLRVLNDPDATAEARIGAAVALHDAERATASAAIRIAADACANEPVRAALERVLTDELSEKDVDAAAKALSP